MNLLHVEDSPSDAFLIKQSLCNHENALHDYDVTQVETISDALKTLGSMPQYNAILLDLHLPDGNGVRNIDAIKSINPDIPIIVVTGDTNEETALQALSHGAQEYIVKDHSNGHMIQRVIQSSIFRKRVELELSKKAYNDSLTGLPNRSFFEHAARGLLRSAQRQERADALMFIDLNKFKQINDTMGHEAGNIVLQAVAKRLKNTLRTSDLIARYAGDEFVVYIDSGKDPVTEELCQFIAEKIVREIERPISIQGNDIEISLSIGIAIFPDAGATFDILLKNADAQMYEAKNDPNKKYSIIGKRGTNKNKTINTKKIINDPINENNPRQKILIIDDSEEDRALYRGALQHADTEYEIIETATIREGERALKKYKPDCILLDYNLPDATGIDFLKKQKKLGKKITAAIIMMTGFNNRETAVEAMKNGAKDFLIKNETDNDRFTQVIKNAIEKQKLEIELKIYQKELERSNSELSDFAQTVAHDLKAPMRKIFMFCEMLAEQTDGLENENIQNCVGRMSLSSDRMQRLIDDLLEYSQIMHETEEKKTTCLQSLVQEIIEDLSIWLKKEKAEINVQNLPKWPVYNVRMRQLFTNLITNAVKYRSSDRDCAINISSNLEKSECQIHFVDNGLGIDHDQLQKIFTPFHRLHAADEIEGTGLGLSICQKIAEKHAGELSVTSKKGEGSTFTISLPHDDNT